METGAAIKVRINDPTNRPGSFDKPSEIAPSSRKGSTTKYALKMKKKHEEEWRRAEVSWGCRVTNTEANASKRDLLIMRCIVIVFVFV